MSNDVKALSISFRSDDGCIEHNNRDFFTDNVDKSRTPNNITYVKRDLRELYHELFDEALAEYNAKQSRPDRQIPDYYEHIRKGKKEKLFQEIIVMFGNSDNCGVGSENWETAVKLLDEYMREFEKRNPNLKVFNAVMHLDEAMVHYLSFISTVIDYAIKMDMLSDNPCRRVTIPKGGKKERKILSIQETEEFLKLLETAPLKWRTFFTLDIYSGMRRGEMLGLEWKDIDFETGVVHIQRTSNYTKARGIYTDTTKTENSVRFIKLPPEVLAILEQFRAEQESEKQRLGSKWIENDRLFTKWNGLPMNPQTPYGWLKEFCEKHNFPFYGIHQYRHLHASLLIGAGIDPTTVSGILGHSQVSTSLNIYGHMFRENQVKACNAVAEALDFKKRGA